MNTEELNQSAENNQSEEQPSTPQQDLSVNTSNEKIRIIENAGLEAREEIQKIIIGQTELIELLIAGILAGGHVLLEGVPGIAKTLTVKILAKLFNAGFKRIQFTPDLMPSDVIGTSVFNMKTSDFHFRKGPVFSNIILIDEINRAPAKTQAALFEVMEEKQVTVDGNTYQMEFPLYIVATQNPIEQEGTYKLPEAQLDRFLFRLKLDYPTSEEEIRILQRFKDKQIVDLEKTVKSVFDPKKLTSYTKIIDSVYIKDELLKYITDIIMMTRESGDLFLGASPRASIAIMKTSKVIAAMRGRDFVTPDDIQYVTYPVLNHRIILSPEREMEGVNPEDIITGIINRIEVPR
jgi:MoxR-like ATPase